MSLHCLVLAYAVFPSWKVRMNSSHVNYSHMAIFNLMISNTVFVQMNILIQSNISVILIYTYSSTTLVPKCDNYMY